MPDIIALLWVLFALFVVGAILYVLYNPPKTLLKFRHKNSELEIAAPLQTTVDEPHDRELDGKAGKPPARVDEGASVEEDTPFAKAYRLLKSGNYAEGIVLIKEEAESKGEKERSEYVALGQHIAALAGSEEALNDLRNNAVIYPQHAAITYLLGLTLKDHGDIEGAITALRHSQDAAVNCSELTTASVTLAAILAEHDNDSEAIQVLTAVHPKIEIRKELARIYAELAAIYKNLTPPRLNMAFAMFELSLEADPTNDWLRFETAYTLANAGGKAQSLFHYRQLLGRHSDYNNAANNAGVVAGELGLPVAQVQFYRKAAALGETLPMANLAGKLINEGFVTEARELVDSALTMPETHRNVLQAMGRIAEVEADEDAKMEGLQKRSASFTKWRIRYGKAVLLIVEDYSSLSGRYSDGSITVDVVVEPQGQFHGTIVGGGKRELNGTLVGAAGEFSWSTVAPANAVDIGALMGNNSGTGAWIFSGDSIVGYMVDKANEVDPARTPGWNVRELRRLASGDGQTE